MLPSSIKLLYLYLCLPLVSYILYRYYRLHQVKIISKDKLSEFLTRQPILLDVRDRREVDGRSVEGANHCPLDEISDWGSGEKKDLILTFCNSGIRSYKACETLNKMGYKKAYCYSGAYRDLE